MTPREVLFGLGAVAALPFRAAWEFREGVTAVTLFASLVMVALGWANFFSAGREKKWLIVAIVGTAPWALLAAALLACAVRCLAAFVGTAVRRAFQDGARAANAHRVAEGGAVGDETAGASGDVKAAGSVSDVESSDAPCDKLTTLV